VVHLHRGAGFGASPAEVRRGLEQGFEASLARVLEGRVRAAPQDFDELQASLAEHAVTHGDARHLQAWWVWRMLVGPDPLRERLALLWHDHFATSQLKVQDLVLMHRQNEVFRRDALAPFGQLLAHSVKEPALLLWLDAETNRKGHPNENLARELMELFTLGIGNYTERDVKEAARALTGWIVREEGFVDRDVRHDEGEKEILGQRGPWAGDDLLRILLAHPATARRLAGKLTREFLGDGVADEAALSSLASGLSERGLDLRWAVETILRSELFFSAAARGRRVVGPAEFVVGTVRTLAMHEPPPSTVILAHWIARAGLDLFFPPNVGGWPGGLSWLAPGELVARANYVEALIGGQGTARPALDDAELHEELAPLAGEQDVREVLTRLLVGRPLADAEGGRAVLAHSSALDPSLPELARALLSGPEAHLA
jgi:uncharacterized protein (DUF1800 family)